MITTTLPHPQTQAPPNSSSSQSQSLPQRKPRHCRGPTKRPSTSSKPTKKNGTPSRKASQWEEVAVTVAARCNCDEPSKTATQCRHKIEKLRKRYRTEKQRPYPYTWLYFDLMYRMERGPLPISAQPMAMIQYQNSNSNDEEDYNYESKKNKSNSINHIVHKLSGGSDRVSRVLPNPISRKRREYFESDDDDDHGEGEGEEAGGREMVAELAVEIRAFAERFVRMENNKMEMMRETEKCLMEMENKRMEMILESQRKIVDTIGRAFSSHKKLKMAQEI